MAISRAEMKMMERKLDKMEIEVMKMKAKLLPVEKISKKELAELKKIEAEMRKGKLISARKLYAKLNLG